MTKDNKSKKWVCPLCYEKFDWFGLREDEFSITKLSLGDAEK